MSTSFGENVFAKDVLKRTAAAIPGLWAPRQGDLHARSGSASTKRTVKICRIQKETVPQYLIVSWMLKSQGKKVFEWTGRLTPWSLHGVI